MKDSLYLGGAFDFETLVQCPICGNENVHIGKVIVNQNGNVTEITKNEINKLKVQSKHRGTVVKILFWCEEDQGTHNFVKVFHFHKGVTAEEEQVIDVNRELWRD